MSCCHTISTRVGLFGESSLVRMSEDVDNIVEKYKECHKIFTYKRSNRIAKIKNNKAEGGREVERLRHWDDILQPNNRDGTRNDRFEKLYPRTFHKRERHGQDHAE